MAIDFSMKKNSNMVTFGLGVTDPKGIFGSTLGLEKKYGKDRVFDVPASENALTGIGIGLSLSNHPSLLNHQRADFSFLSFDQIINSASKWHYMFDGASNIPFTIRMIIGKGWGQGPTHSQNLHSVFSHFPGLKVVVPSVPEDAGNLLISSIFDPNPVIFLEHRWLHNLKTNSNIKFKTDKIKKYSHLIKGTDITVVSISYMTIEAIQASKILKNEKISIDLISLNLLNPMDYSPILKSLKKTKRLLVLETDFEQCSIGSQIISHIAQKINFSLKAKPRIIASDNLPEPTSFGLTKFYYKNYVDIIKTILQMLNVKKKIYIPKRKSPHDIPDKFFQGPF